MTGPHLDADTLAAYVDGRLPPVELGEIEHHIDTCGSCRSELSSLAALRTNPVGLAADVSTKQLGRYQVLSELGHGSMGVVLRAYDPELARPVAIKLVREDAGTRELVRAEARALARLRHPNVVTVYDVIAEGEHLYIAMELVDGDTLRGYCRTRPSSAVLAACLRAGRGLAAAHAAGVIHRDFKPENVLCTDGGEVRVSDFGLAATIDSAASGLICGTPAYMAPEIKRGAPATAASDQYSFCVATHEMLTGERPGASVDTKLPAWIARALDRGLAEDPGKRFPSLAALLDQLERDPAVRRRRVAWTAIGLLAASATTVGAVKLASRAAPSCALDLSALQEAWTPDRRTTTRAAITAVGGAELAGNVTEAVDAYAAAWLDARRDACAAARERGEQDDDLLARRVACLDRGRRELAELTFELTTADARVAAAAPEAIGKLRDPSACAAPGRDDVVARVLFAEDRAAIDRAGALDVLGKLDEAEALIDPVIARAATPQLLADALVARSEVAIERGQQDRAESTLFDALRAAETARDDTLVAAIWVDLVMTTGAQEHKFEVAMTDARAAEAAFTRVEPGVDLQWRYAYTLGNVLLAHGDLAAARTHLETAVALIKDDAHRRVQAAQAHISLCDVARQQGDLAAAGPHCERGIDLLESAFGKDHLRVAVALNTAAVLAFASHDLDTAEQMYLRAIAIFEHAGARAQLVYALALSNLGALYSTRDDTDRAREYFERAQAIFAEHHPAHPQRVMPIQGLASLALGKGDGALAVTYYTQVLDVMAATYATDSPQVLSNTFNLALAYRIAKQPERARTLLDELVARALKPKAESWMLAARALDVLGALAEDRHDSVAAIAARQRALDAIGHVDDPATRALILRQLGESERLAHHPDRALPLLEAALAYYERSAEDSYDLGIARYVVAMTLVDANLDRPRAVALLTKAAGDLSRAQSGEALEELRQQVAHALQRLATR